LCGAGRVQDVGTGNQVGIGPGGLSSPRAPCTEAGAGAPNKLSLPGRKTVAMLSAVSSSLARAAGRVPLQRSAAAAFPGQGSLPAAQQCQNLPLDSSHHGRQSSSSSREQSPWCQVRWQLGVSAAATASLIGSSRCADDDEDEEEVQVTYLPSSCLDQSAYLAKSPSWLLTYNYPLGDKDCAL
jgi:hypothetical protein